MEELKLFEEHQTIIMDYLKFARYQRNQNLKTVEHCFRDAIDTRLYEDTYTCDEVKELFQNVCSGIIAEVESELLSSSHTNILLLQQIFKQAEKWHLRLSADISELQNRDLLELVKKLDNNLAASNIPEKTPSSPVKVKLAPMEESSGTVALLQNEIDRLTIENTKLRAVTQEGERRSNRYIEELKSISKDLTAARLEVVSLQEMSELANTVRETRTMDQMEDELTTVRNLLATNLELSFSNQAQLELELSTTRKNLETVQSQLKLAELELDKKFSETATFLNMRQMIMKKNDQMKQLREKLHKFETPDWDTNQDESDYPVKTNGSAHGDH